MRRNRSTKQYLLLESLQELLESRSCWRQELLESLPASEMLRFAFGNKRSPHINVGEMRSRRALWRFLAQDPRAHCRRHLVVYDSSATVGASNKGRSLKTGMLREARLTYPYLLAADCTEGTLWTDS